MVYNWQQKDWGKFTFSEQKLENLLFVILEKTGNLKGLLKAMPNDSKKETLIELLVSEAIKTSAIENEYLSREDVISSIRNNLGLYEPNTKNIDDRAKGVGKLLTTVRNTYHLPLSETVLKKWHRYLFTNNTKLNVGVWRKHTAPMQVISGPIGREKVHFEAPPSKDIPLYMKNFIQWFNETTPKGKNPIKFAAIRAGIAHIYFESIHPFEDGNGRIGRAIADKALSQSAGFPMLLSLSYAIEVNKKAYYNALENGQKSNEITSWLIYFLKVVIEAQKNTELLINFTLKKARYFDQYSDKLNKRQLKVINRMFKEGIKGFKGGMTAKKYIKIAKTSKATATRDLQHLEKIGALKMYGKGRNTYYALNL